jgi:hypothetical protein
MIWLGVAFFFLPRPPTGRHTLSFYGTHFFLTRKAKSWFVHHEMGCQEVAELHGGIRKMDRRSPVALCGVWLYLPRRI